MLIIESPIKGYTGISAGVGFALGKAMVKRLTPTQKRYFEKKGYVITNDEVKKEQATAVPGIDNLQPATAVTPVNSNVSNNPMGFEDPSMIE